MHLKTNFPTCRGSKDTNLHIINLGTRQKWIKSFTFRPSYLRCQEVDGSQSRPYCCDVDLPALLGIGPLIADRPFFDKVHYSDCCYRRHLCFFLVYLFIFCVNHSAFTFVSQSVEYYDGQYYWFNTLQPKLFLWISVDWSKLISQRISNRQS